MRLGVVAKIGISFGAVIFLFALASLFVHFKLEYAQTVLDETIIEDTHDHGHSAHLLRLQDLRDRLFIFSGVVLMLCVLGLFFSVFSYFTIRKQVSKSLDQLNKGALKISTGNLQYRINLTDDPDFGKLSFSFNEMAHKLAQAQGILKNNLEQIEKQVDDRTEELVHANRLLEEQVIQRKKLYDSLIRSMRELEETKYHLEQEKLSVEKKVQARTKKLEIARLHIMSLLEQKQAFLNQIAHDLRTPLTPIIGSLQLLQLNSPDPKNKQYVDEGIKNANYLNHLLNDILELARLDGDASQFNFEMISLNAVLQEVLEGQRVVFENNNVAIKTDLEEVPPLSLDIIKIKEVLHNIISNAMKFSGDDLEITFTLRKTERGADLHITDNGIGMEQEELDKIFNDFYQVDGSRHERSAGLGLPIAQRIMQAHDGNIIAESEGHGKGSTFTLQFRERQHEKEYHI